jgi:hypothetical protein
VNIENVKLAHSELQSLTATMRAAVAERDLAKEALESDNLTTKAWSDIVAVYVRTNALVNRLQFRNRVLRGRIHFEAQTV